MNEIQDINDRIHSSVTYLSTSFNVSKEALFQAVKDKKVRSQEVNGETLIDFNDFIKWLQKTKKRK